MLSSKENRKTMMSINFPIVIAAAVIPMFVGFIWYHDKTFGKPWQKASGVTDEMINGGNMALIMGLSFVFSCMLSMMLMTLCIHQFQVQGLFASDPGFGEPGSASTVFLEDFFSRFGDKHRTWSHGAVHGAFLSIFVILPVIAIKALFERKNFKYILINFGYWLVTISAMCAVLCAFV